MNQTSPLPLVICNLYLSQVEIKIGNGTKCYHVNAGTHHGLGSFILFFLELMVSILCKIFKQV